jgi:peroxiredoxin Q/BCP
MSRKFLPLVVSWVMLSLLAGCEGRRPLSNKPATMPSAEEMESAASARSTARGKPAPDFELLDQRGRPVSLQSLRGKWVVLYFYPADDTPACTCQATEFTWLLWSFASKNATVLGISADSPQQHQKFIEKYDLKVDLLSDPDHRVMRSYGAWVDVPTGPAAPGRVIRNTFLIDPEGVIAWHWPEVIPWGHAKRVADRLESLTQQAHAAESGPTPTGTDTAASGSTVP